MSLIVIVVEASTLFFILNIQKKENKQTAIAEAKAISQSLNNDLLKYILAPNAAMLSDITFRLSAFTNIKGVMVYDEKKEAIYQYGQIDDLAKNKEDIFLKQTIFKDEELLIKTSLKPYKIKGFLNIKTKFY